MPDIRVLKLYETSGGMSARVRRVDGSEVACPLIVNGDGSLGVKRPRGDWLVEAPPEPMKGQDVFVDAGEEPT
jgi:hypothetical protein